MKTKSPQGRTTGITRRLCSLVPMCAAALLFSGGALTAAVPADPTVEMRFSNGPGSGNGLTTPNDGYLSGLGTFSDPAGTNTFPAFTTNVPAGPYVPGSNAYALDLGNFVPGAEGRAVDLVTTANPPGDGTLGALPQVTVAAWVNARTFSTRNAIAYALASQDGLGFSFAASSVGKLMLGINEDASGLFTSVYSLPTDGNVGSNNWVFVAATYNPNLSSNQLSYYIGRPNKLAYLDTALTYTGGDITTSNVDVTGPLTVGNYGSVDANRTSPSSAGNPLFRGVIDEVKVYTNALTLDQIQQVQINSAVTPVAASIISGPANQTAAEAQNATFTVDATGSGTVTYQWKTNGVDIVGATNSSVTLTNVTLAQIGLQVRVGVSNTVGGVLSPNASLSVLPANPQLMYLSYVEGNDKTTNSTITAANQNITTTNVGNVQGKGYFLQKNSTSGNFIGAGTYPVFSTNVPVGPYAPAFPYDQFALNMGDIRYTNFPAGGVGSQGGRAVDYTNSIGSPLNSLGKMSALTICVWVNAGNLTFRGNNGGMGPQIIFAEDEPGRNGFSLSHKADWSVQLNVNEWPGGAGNRSFGLLPVVQGPDGNAIFPSSNWVFVAVTYDGTLTSQNLNYYFGSGTALATLDATSPQDYNKGIINYATTAPVTVGNLNSVTTLSGRTINGDNAAFFRGLIDEVHIFSRVLTLAEIQQVQVAPAMPSYLAVTPQTGAAKLSWDQGAQPLFPTLQLQASPSITAGGWTNVTAATNVTGSIRSLTVPTTSGPLYYRLLSK